MAVMLIAASFGDGDSTATKAATDPPASGAEEPATSAAPVSTAPASTLVTSSTVASTTMTVPGMGAVPGRRQRLSTQQRLLGRADVMIGWAGSAG